MQTIHKKLVVASVFVAVLSLSFAERASAAPIPVSSYTYTTTGGYHFPGAFPDTGTIELTDGLYPTIGVGTAFSDARWSGSNDGIAFGGDGLPQPEITFNFGSSFALNSFTVIYDVEHSPQIFAPDNVSVSYSANNVTYSAPVTLTGFDDSVGPFPVTRSTTFSFPINAQGQYARLAFNNDEDWTFLAEVQFDGQVVPEPSTVLLLGLGGLTMLSFARRKLRS